MLARLDLVLLFLLVYDMSVKPEIDDAAFVGGLLGAAIAAALVYWRYTVALGQPAPGPAAGTPAEPG
jgi:apolipoprotein N-acyltransferase